MTRAEFASNLQPALRRENLAFSLYVLLVLIADAQVKGEEPSMLALSLKHGTTYLSIWRLIDRNEHLFVKITDDVNLTKVRLSGEGRELLSKIDKHIETLSCQPQT